MKQINIKKVVIPNIPYVFIALFATKLGQGWRLSTGGDFSAKVLHLLDGLAAAFRTVLPSFHPIDICVGIAVAGLIRLIVYSMFSDVRERSMFSAMNRLLLCLVEPFPTIALIVRSMFITPFAFRFCYFCQK